MILKSYLQQLVKPRLLLLILAISAVSTLTQAQPSETRIPTSTAGVTVIEIEDPAGPWSIRVVEWNRNEAPNLRLVPAKGAVESTERVAALETTSSIANRNGTNYKQVVAAVNADFFSRRGEPVNRMKLDGEWILSHPDNPRRSVLTIDEKNQLWAGQTTLSTNLCRKSPSIYPSCVPVQWNRSPVPGSASMLNHWFSDTLSNAQNSRVFTVRADKETDLMSATHGTLEFELAVERSQDLLVDSYAASLTATPRLDKGDRLVILDGDFWDDFTTRDTLSIETIINGPLTLPKQLIGGGPLMLRDGRMVVDSMATAEGILESFLTTRHPRTALGWNTDQTIVWLVVVDGRQEHSAGMSLHELSQFFLKLGASDALNLDGGGSSAIVADGKVLNSPSDPTGERRVTNALLLIK
jgi:hypothetical protein